jgi:hypothetical protein
MCRSPAKRAKMMDKNQSSENEGGHMSSIAGRVLHVPSAKLPYLVILTHHETEATQKSFATMREAEAFIKRNTPVPHPGLSSLYDRLASDW